MSQDGHRDIEGGNPGMYYLYLLPVLAHSTYSNVYSKRPR